MPRLFLDRPISHLIRPALVKIVLIFMLFSRLLSAMPLIDAIEQVESGAHHLAHNPDSKALGPLQVTPVVVRDVNRIYHLKFRHADMTDKVLSGIVFLRYTEAYATPERLGRPVTDRDRALVWRHGPDGWKREESEYWNRVQNLLSK